MKDTTSMQIGKLTFEKALDNLSLVAEPTKDLIVSMDIHDIFAAEINPSLADTAEFCDHYDIGMDVSANCVVVQARRADRTWYAACMILATTQADVNKTIKKHLDARKISFAPMDTAVELTGMEYGGINPIGLPKDWPLLIDTAVDNTDQIIIGSGLRRSKIATKGSLLKTLPNAVVMDITRQV